MDLRLAVTIHADGRDDGSYGDLTVNETISLPSKSFVEIASILGRFHDLSENIHKETK